MTPEQQRIAIAEWCGWTKIKTSGGGFVAWSCQDGETDHWSRTPPDYLNDLNAMHEAEKRLSLNEWVPYLDGLDKVCVPVHICPTTHAIAVYCATAAQRAEALLRTIGKWDDKA